MASLRSKVASALSFAHLAGFGAKADTTDENEEKPVADNQDTGDTSQDRENGDSKKAADSDEDDPQREGESDDDYARRMKKAKGDKGDDTKDYADDDADDSDQEMRGSSPAATARRRERARCAAIFSSKAAARNPVLAANLAFNTTMTRKEALAVLEGTPAAQQPGAGRAARNPNLGAGGPVEHNAQAAAVDRMAKKLAQFARR